MPPPLPSPPSDALSQRGSYDRNDVEERAKKRGPHHRSTPATAPELPGRNARQFVQPVFLFFPLSVLSLSVLLIFVSFCFFISLFPFFQRRTHHAQPHQSLQKPVSLKRPNLPYLGPKAGLGLRPVVTCPSDAIHPLDSLFPPLAFFLLSPSHHRPLPVLLLGNASCLGLCLVVFHSLFSRCSFFSFCLPLPAVLLFPFRTATWLLLAPPSSSLTWLSSRVLTTSKHTSRHWPPLFFSMTTTGHSLSSVVECTSSTAHRVQCLPLSPAAD